MPDCQTTVVLIEVSLGWRWFVLIGSKLSGDSRYRGNVEINVKDRSQICHSGTEWVARFDLILALCLLIVPCLPYSWWQGRNLFDKCCHSSSLFHCLITGMDIGQVCANSHIDSVQLYGKTCFYNFGNFKQHFQRLACFVQTSHSFSSITCRSKSTTSRLAGQSCGLFFPPWFFSSAPPWQAPPSWGQVSRTRMTMVVWLLSWW